MQKVIVISKLVGLCIVLNLVRYFLIGFVEQALVFDYLFGAMEESKDHFNLEYSTIDWISSFAYNFVMWFTILFAFHVVHPFLSGLMVVRSLKVFGVMLVFFLSINAITMNHYSHPKDFYVWNMVDAMIVFPLMGIVNGYLYPRFFRPLSSSDAEPAVTA